MARELAFNELDEMSVSFHVGEALGILGKHASNNALPVPLMFSLHVRHVDTTMPSVQPQLTKIAEQRSEWVKRHDYWCDAALDSLGFPAGQEGSLALAASGLGGANHSIIGWFTKYNLAWAAYAHPKSASFSIDWGWQKRLGMGGMPQVSQVIAHEIGHVFQAQDEYDSKPPPGSFRTRCSLLDPNGHGFGKLGHPNRNCERINPGSMPCIMRHHSEADYVCASTRAHWGWVDNNNDGIHDALQ